MKTLPCILFLFVSACLCSCGDKTSKEQNSKDQSAAMTADTTGETASADSVTSEYVNRMIHSGRTVLLNFCFCCDCRVTIPMLEEAIEGSSFPVDMVTVDVKEHFDLADEYDVMRTPFYMLFHETGELLDTLYGYKGKDMIEARDVQRWLTANMSDTERRTK